MVFLVMWEGLWRQGYGMPVDDPDDTDDKNDDDDEEEDDDDGDDDGDDDEDEGDSDDDDEDEGDSDDDNDNEEEGQWTSRDLAICCNVFPTVFPAMSQAATVSLLIRVYYSSKLIY